MNDAPWNAGLPTTLTVVGQERAIHTDYRAVLDIFLALTDRELDDHNRTAEFLDILYEDEIPLKDWQEAIEKGLWFINGGDDEKKKKSRTLISWTQDYNMIAAPISKIVGRDIRGMEYLHWWSFLSAYMSIGDCLFAQVVRIRDLRSRGKPLSKEDREFYRRNVDIIEIKTKISEEEERLLKEWM